MLIGHRFERTSQGDLHIHSRNRVQSAVMVVMGALSVIAPVAFVVFGIATGLLVDMHPLHLLLIVLALLLIAALALLMLVYTGTRETLELSRRDGEGKRRTHNFFGRRERVQPPFKIKGPKRLELRRRQHAKPIYTQLWLVMRDGPEHRLTTDNVAVVPGSERTDVWLRELAEYLEVPVPTEVVELPLAGATPSYSPAPTRANAANSPQQRKGKDAPASAESTEKIGIPGRALLTLVGAFLAVLELNQVIALVRALFTGRLRFSGVRSGSASFYWAEQPLTFSFNVLVGFAEVLVIGFIAWSCLRTAIQGRMKSNP